MRVGLHLYVLDQAAVSAGNFLTALLAANICVSLSEYGVFAGFFSLIIILNSFQDALILYPLTLRLAGGARAPDTYANSLLLSVAAAIPSCLILCAYGLSAGRPQAGLWAVVALFAWQTQELLRRGRLAVLDPLGALRSDVIRYSIQVMGLLLIGRQFHPTAELCLAWIAFCSLAGAVAIRVQIQSDWANLRTTARDYFNCGRWVLASKLLGLFTAQGAVVVLSLLDSSRAAGLFYATSNVARVLQPLLLAAATQLVALIAAAHKNSQPVGRKVWGTILLLLIGSSLYTLLLWTYPLPIWRLLYPGQDIDESLINVMRSMAVWSFLTCGSMMLNSSFYGMSESRAVLFIDLFANLFVPLPWLILGQMTPTAMVYGLSLAECMRILCGTALLRFRLSHPQWRTVLLHKVELGRVPVSFS